MMILFLSERLLKIKLNEKLISPSAKRNDLLTKLQTRPWSASAVLNLTKLYTFPFWSGTKCVNLSSTELRKIDVVVNLR